jgi:hypothetical protein
MKLWELAELAGVKAEATVAGVVKRFGEQLTKDSILRQRIETGRIDLLNTKM